jgi:hypothetical protein
MLIATQLDRVFLLRQDLRLLSDLLTVDGGANLAAVLECELWSRVELCDIFWR